MTPLRSLSHSGLAFHCLGAPIPGNGKRMEFTLKVDRHCPYFLTIPVKRLYGQKVEIVQKDARWISLLVLSLFCQGRASEKNSLSGEFKSVIIWEEEVRWVVARWGWICGRTSLL